MTRENDEDEEMRIGSLDSSISLGLFIRACRRGSLVVISYVEIVSLLYIKYIFG